MTPVEQFGPLALKAVRDAMVAKGWTRGTVNAEIDRIRRVFRFAVENELLKDATVLNKLEASESLHSHSVRKISGLRMWFCEGSIRRHFGAQVDECSLRLRGVWQ